MLYVEAMQRAPFSYISYYMSEMGYKEAKPLTDPGFIDDSLISRFRRADTPLVDMNSSISQYLPPYMLAYWLYCINELKVTCIYQEEKDTINRQLER